MLTSKTAWRTVRSGVIDVRACLCRVWAHVVLTVQQLLAAGRIRFFDRRYVWV